MFLHPGLAALGAILRHGSFDRAADALGLSQSAISQRLHTLEERVGAPLVLRTHPATATETGLRLLRHADEIARLEATLADDLGRAAEGPLRLAVATNADSLATWLVPALAEVPDALFDLVIDDQDHSADFLRKGRVAAAITAHGEPIQGCDTHALGALRYVATASPGFAARWFRDGLDAVALSRAPALVFDEKDRLQADWAAGVAGRRVSLTAHRLPSATAFVDAACHGIGWGLNPEPLVSGRVASGDLVVLPGPPLDTPLYWQVSRIGADALAPLTKAVRAAAARTLHAA